MMMLLKLINNDITLDLYTYIYELWTTNYFKWEERVSPANFIDSERIDVKLLIRETPRIQIRKRPQREN